MNVHPGSQSLWRNRKPGTGAGSGKPDGSKSRSASPIGSPLSGFWIRYRRETPPGDWYRPWLPTRSEPPRRTADDPHRSGPAKPDLPGADLTSEVTPKVTSVLTSGLTSNLTSAKTLPPTLAGTGNFVPVRYTVTVNHRTKTGLFCPRVWRAFSRTASSGVGRRFSFSSPLTVSRDPTLHPAAGVGGVRRFTLSTKNFTETCHGK